MPTLQVAGDQLVSMHEGFKTAGELAQLAPPGEPAKILAQFEASFGPGLEGPAPVEFVEIGLNKPLTVMIRHIYTGKYPKSGALGGKKDLAVVSALKDYSVFGAASRAVNFLQRGVKAKAHIGAPKAPNEGTAIVAYQPAVVSDQILLTIEGAFDTFPKDFVDSIGDAIASAAGIPLFLPWAGYLMTASAVTKLASGLGEALFDGRPSFSLDAQFSFNIPGAAPPVAGFYIACRNSFPKDDYKFDPTKEGLVHKTTGEVYDGDEAYVVLSLDGAPRKGLENFAPTVASAAILKRFFDMKDQATASVTAVVDGLKLLSDSKYRTEADQLKKEIAAFTGTDAEKKKLQDRYDALLKNIMSEEMKPKP